MLVFIIQSLNSFEFKYINRNYFKQMMSPVRKNNGNKTERLIKWIWSMKSRDLQFL